MKSFGIQLQEGSNITNLTVGSGTAFPSDPNEGELFYRSDADITVIGLYAYINGNWDRISSSDSITAPKAASFPGTANTGDIFYKDSNDSSEGLYVYNGSTWDALTATATTFHVDAPTEVTLASTDNAIQLGATSGVNVVFDSNEVQARNNGSASALSLNPHGGAVTVGASGVVSSEVLSVSTTTAGSNAVLAYLQNNGSTTGTGAGLGFATNSNSAATTTLATISGIATNATGSGDLSFSTATSGTVSEKMKITGAGQVLIGDTTEAMSSERLSVGSISSGTVNTAAVLHNAGTLAGTGTQLGFTTATGTGGLFLFSYLRLTGGASGTNFSFTTSSNSGTETERLRITDTGMILAGTTTSMTVGGNTRQLQLEGFGTSGISTVKHSADAVQSVFVLGKSRGTTAGSVTAVQSGDGLGSIKFAGADGTNMSGASAEIAAFVDGDTGTGDVPGRLVFSTAPDGSAVPVERMRITSSGAIKMGQMTTQSGQLTLTNTDAVAGKRLLLTFPSTGNWAGTVRIYMTRSTGDTSGSNHIVHEYKIARTGAATGSFAYFAVDSHTGGSYTAALSGYDADWYFDTTTGIAYLRFGHGSNSTLYTYEAILNDSTALTFAVDGGTAPSGTVVEPSFSITNGGAFNYMMFSTGGAEAMRISSTGSIGFGTTAPQVAFQFGGDSTYREVRLRRSSDAPTGQALAFLKTRGTETSPTAVQSGDTLGTMAFAAWDGSTTGNAAWIQGYADATPGSGSTPGRLIFGTSASGSISPTERMRIDSSGNVFIGGSMPVTHKTVITHTSGTVSNSTGTATLYLHSSATAGVGVGPALVFGGKTGNTTTDFGFSAIQGFKDSATAGDYTGGMSFHTSTTGGTTLFAERMRIDGLGHVGIGTTPAANRRLDIAYAANTAARVQFTNSDAGTGADARIVSSNGTVETGLIMRGTGFTGAGNQALWYVTNDNPLVFSTNGLERARVNSVGLGVGGTPAARPLEVHNNTRALLRLSANATTGTDALGGLEFSSYDGTSVGVGATILHNYSLQSSLANALVINVIRDSSFVVKTNNTDRLQIDGTGNVGIGGTALGGKLHVIGGSIRQTNSSDGNDGLLQYNSAGTRVGALFGAGSTYYRLQADSGVGRLALNTVSGYINFEVNSVEKMRMTNAGELLIGATATRIMTAGASMKEQIEAADNSSGLSMTRNTVDTSGPNLRFLKTRGTVVGAVTTVQTGDSLGQIQWFGTDGTNIIASSEIRAEVDAGPGTSDMPGRIVFLTTADGASSVTERMRLTSTGQVLIGHTATVNSIYAAANAIPGLSVFDTTSAASSILLMRNDSTGAASTPLLSLGRSRNATTGAHTVVQVGDTLGAVNFVGSDGSAFKEAAKIIAQSDTGTPSATSMAGRLAFFTTPNASVTPAERMRIDSAGIFTIGSAAATAPRAIEIAGGNTSGSINVLNIETATANQYSGMTIVRNDNASAQLGASINLARTRGAAVGAVTSVTSGDTLGGIAFSGADGTDIRTNAAEILAMAEGTVGASVMPGRLVFSTTGAGGNTPTERMRIDSAGIMMVGQTTATGDAKIQVSNGVRFGGTTSTDVNTLDFYQEGTFTPVVAGSTTAGTGTYNTQVGFYTRVGNTVDFTLTVTWTTHTGAGNLLVTGLPFTSNATGNRIYSVSVMSSNLTFTGQLGGWINNGQTRIDIGTQSSAVANASLALDTAATLWITGTYQV